MRFFIKKTRLFFISNFAAGCSPRRISSWGDSLRSRSHHLHDSWVRRGEALLWIISLTTSSTLNLILSFTFSKTSTVIYSTSWPALMDSFTETAHYLFLLWGICIKTPRFRDALSDTTTKICVSSINSAKLFYFYCIIIIHYCCKNLYNRPIVFMVPNFNSIIYILLLYFINILCIRYYIQRRCQYNKLAPYSWRSLNCFF